MSDEYDSAVAASLTPDTAQAARVGYAVGSGYDPQTYAEAQRAARLTGVPVETALNMPKEIKRQVDMGSIDFDALAKTSPATAALLADTERAKIAHDDIENMGQIERKLRQFGGGVTEAVGMAVSGTGHLLDIAQRNILGGLANLVLPTPRAPGLPTTSSIVGDLMGSDWRTAGGEVKGFARNSMMIPAAQQTFGDQVAGGLGQVAGQIAMLPIARGSGLYTQGADTMAEKLSGDKLTSGQRDAGILLGAGITGVTEKWALDKLLGPMALPIKNQILASLARFGIGALAEGGQEFSENTMQDAVRSALTGKNQIDIGQSLGEGGVGAAVGGIVRSVVEAGLHIRIRGQRAEQAEAQAQQIEQINQFAAASKLLQRDPESFQAFVDHAAESGPVRDVFISAQALMQSGVAEQVAAVSPAVAEQMQQAVDTGGDIRIPVGEYAAKIAPTEFAQSLVDHLKTDPEGFTRAEAQEYMQTQGEELQREVERVLADRAGDDAFKASTESVKANIKAQLDAAGRFTESAHDAYASLVGNFYGVTAAKLGITPDELLQRYPLKVQAEDVTGGAQFDQGPRGSFSPATNTIALLKDADLSTFLHETGHFSLEMQLDLAGRLSALEEHTVGEQSLLADAHALLSWFGVRDLNEWHALDFEEKRHHHEQFARGFEAYLFEGRAPSIELQSLFQRFRAWMINVYKDLKALNVELTDEVRGVMDRMLATGEQIQLAEQGRSMMQLFRTAEQGGMTPEEFAAYQAMGADATNDAIEDLQARGLRDLQWMRNARSREISRLQKDADTKRAAIRMDVRREVMSQPVYRAWQFLTSKISKGDKIAPPERFQSDPDIVDPGLDSMLVAIAKLGGLNRESAAGLWGIKPEDKPQSGLFGKPVLRAEGKGWTVDQMAEKLAELGYLAPDENGNTALRYFEEAFQSELGGSAIYSSQADYDLLRAGDVRPGDQVANVGALTAGRLDAAGLADIGAPVEAVSAVEARRMTAKTGLHPDIVAELFSYSSGDELVRALAEATPPKEEIDALTDQRMLEQHGDLASADAIAKAADKAIHNEARGRMIATELNMLVKATGQRKVMASAAREYAAAMIARLRIRDIRPGQYASAEARAARAAEKASRAGDLAAAAAEKRNELVNHFATKVAYDTQGEVERIVRYFGTFDSAGVRKSIDAGYVAQIDVLLDKYLLRKQSNRQTDRTASLRTWVQSRLAAGEIPGISSSLLTPAERAAYLAATESRDEDGVLVYADDEERIKLLADAIDRSAKRPYREMTVEELRGLNDTIKQIEHLGRLKNTILTAVDKRNYDAIRDDIAQTIADNAATGGKNTRTATDWLGSKLQAIKQFGASHIKVATWARIMDGGQDDGPVWRYLVRPANDRASQETTMRAAATEALDAILRPVLARVPIADKMGKGQYFPTVGDSLNWQERFTMALNIGNESNMQRLLGGKGWSFSQIKPVLDTLTTAEWHAVQAIWDHFESYRPQIAAKEIRVSGKEPEWIPARSISVQTRDGHSLTLRGGYYPVKFDPRVNLKASQHSAAEEAKNLLKSAYSAATTQRSFTKDRVEEVHGRPLLLNLQGLYSGVNDVIHDLAWHEWVIDANKLLRSTAIDAAMREHYGPEVKREFEKWRDDIVAGNRRLDHAIEQAAGWARQSVSASALTFNLMSAAMQPLGLSNSLARVGWSWVGKGLARYVASPIAATREAREKSAWMENRVRTRFRELNELRNQVQGQTAARELMGRYGYWLMMRTQMMVDVPTWWGGYEKAIANGHDEAAAVAIADQGVKDSQGGGEEVDQSGVERGGPLIKLFTAFYGFMGTTLNTGYLAAKTDASRAKLAADMVLVLCVPAVLGALLKDDLTPGDSGDDDPEKLMKKLLAEQLSFLFGLVAFGREFAPLAKTVTGQGGIQGYSGPAGLRLIPDTLKLAQQAAQGEFDDSFRKAFIGVLGDLTGIPAVQINRTITGAQALAEGKTANPASIAFGFQEKR